MPGEELLWCYCSRTVRLGSGMWSQINETTTEEAERVRPTRLPFATDVLTQRGRAASAANKLHFEITASPTRVAMFPSSFGDSTLPPTRSNVQLDLSQ